MDPTIVVRYNKSTDNNFKTEIKIITSSEFSRRHLNFCVISYKSTEVVKRK